MKASASTVANQVKLLCVMPVSRVTTSSRFPDDLLLFQLTVNEPRKAAKHGPSAWAPAITWEIQNGAPAFSFPSLSCCSHIGE